AFMAMARPRASTRPAMPVSRPLGGADIVAADPRHERHDRREEEPGDGHIDAQLSLFSAATERGDCADDRDDEPHQGPPNHGVLLWFGRSCERASLPLNCPPPRTLF